MAENIGHGWWWSVAGPNHKLVAGMGMVRRMVMGVDGRQRQNGLVTHQLGSIHLFGRVETQYPALVDVPNAHCLVLPTDAAAAP